jgi:hypothetical protein
MVMADDQNSDFAATQVAILSGSHQAQLVVDTLSSLDGDRQKLAKLLVVAQWR